MVFALSLDIGPPARPVGAADDEGRGVTTRDAPVEEARAAQATGLRTIVEMTPIGCGRRPDLMRALASETGMTVVAATGCHRDAHYPAGHWVYEATVEVLADRIVADIRDGMHPGDWDDPALSPDPARAGATHPVPDGFATNAYAAS